MAQNKNNMADVGFPATTLMKPGTMQTTTLCTELASAADSQTVTETSKTVLTAHGRQVNMPVKFRDFVTGK